MAVSKNPAVQVQPRYTEFAYTLAVGEEITIGGVADFVAVLDASAAFMVGFDRGPKTRFKKGLTYRAPVPISSVQVLNDGAAALTVTIAIGKGDIRDARLVLSGGVSTQPAASNFVDGGAISALAAANTPLLAANLARKEAVIYNDGAAAVYVRGDAVAAAGGLLLAAGGTTILETTAAIFAYNSGGAAVSVLVSELVVV